MADQYEDDGFGYEDEPANPSDYPFSVDRRYYPHPVTPIGRSTVDELSGARGTPDPDGDPDLLEPGEMACLLQGRANASQVIVDQGAQLGALSNSVTDTYHRAAAAMEKLRTVTADARERTARAHREVEDLERRFTHVPPERKVPPGRLLRVIAVAAILAFAALDMWFFYKFMAIFWEIPPDSWQAWLLGPLLGLLVALLVWVSGRILGAQLWYLRSSLAAESDRPGGAGPDGRPRSWWDRTARGTWWRLNRLGRRAALPLAALCLAGWTLALVALFGYYRALDDLADVPYHHVALLILSLGMGAMILEMILHNPYVDALASAQAGDREARKAATEAADRTAEALTEFTQYSDALHRRRDEVLSQARTEMDRAWTTAILPSRHRSGRSGEAAPRPARLEGDGQGVHRLSRVPDDREIEAFFRTFAGIPVPPPPLGPVGSVNERLRLYDPEGFRREFEELTGRTDQTPDGDSDDGSERGGDAGAHEETEAAR